MHWLAFMVGVVVLVALDLLSNRGKKMTFKRSLAWTCVWLALSLGLGGVIHWREGAASSIPFFTAFVVEYALSIDNLFVFVLIFRGFRVIPEAQHKLLYWGIAGALVFRFALIAAGVGLVKQFAWVLYVLGGVLLFTGVRLAFSKEAEADRPVDGAVVRFAQRYLRMARQDHALKFFAREDGRLVATKLFLVLLVIETTDIMFAVDSIPAVLGISQDTFIVFASNACAVLGLRSLYFLVSELLGRLTYLKVGLAIVLSFVGFKIIAETAFPAVLGPFHTQILVGSLGFVVLTLTTTILLSLWLGPTRGDVDTREPGA